LQQLIFSAQSFLSVKQHQQQQQQQESQISSPNKQSSFHQQWSPPNKQKQISPPKILSTQQAKTNNQKFDITLNNEAIIVFESFI
jgi:hypothetical protein